MRAQFRNRFFVCVLITIPVLLLANAAESGYYLDGRYFFHGNIYLEFILSTVMFFYGGYPFFRGLFGGVLKLGAFALVIAIGYFYSIVVLFGILRGTVVLFWELTVFIDASLLGFWIGSPKEVLRKET